MSGEPGLDAEKAEARRAARAAVARMTATDRAAASARICARLVDSACWSVGGAVMLFVPMRDEPDVAPLFDAARRAGRCVCVPRLLGPGRMAPAAVRGAADLVPSAAFDGLLEPSPDAALVPALEIGVVVVPGVAFDARGRRLGRGGGFYDRWLVEARVPPERIVGVAFEASVLDRVPTGAQDVRVGAVVTERRWIVAGEGGPQDR